MNNEAKVIAIDSVPALDERGTTRLYRALFPETEAEELADLVEVAQAITTQIETLVRLHPDSRSLSNAYRYAHPLLHALRQYELVISPLEELPF